MSNWNVFPVMFLMLLGFALATAASGVLVFLNWRHRRGNLRASHSSAEARVWTDYLPVHHAILNRPASWLVVRSKNLHAVENALGLHNPRPCTWSEGIAGEKKLFISPPVNGWILVIGQGLPDVSDDVDSCFRFLTNLSRRLGRVQFFSANSILKHHAWVWVENGRVMRAYAWAGQTLWNQGIKTSAELNLGLKCFAYLESPDTLFGKSDVNASNTDKVPLLAGRWSLDPAAIDERVFEHAYGIAGEPSRLY